MKRRRYRRQDLSGATAEKLRMLLEQSGFSSPHLWMQKGAFRSAQWDLARWGGFAVKDGFRVSFHSWDTMTECLRYGFDVTKDSGNTYEISKKSAAASTVNVVRSEET